MIRLPFLVFTILSLFFVPPVRGAELEGRVDLGRGDEAFAGDEVVITFRSEEPGPPAADPDEAFEIVTADKSFEPRVLVVPVGSTVRFPNRDPILHNVFSVSGGNRFDLGLYGPGPGRTVTFESPGVVRVFCNVHHSMVAYVVVVETRWVARSDEKGRFELSGLPEGEGILTVWHPRAEPWSREIAVPSDAPLEIGLEITKPRVPLHADKLGKPYSRRRGRRYR